MTRLPVAAIVSILLVLALCVIDLWVYSDAQERLRRGDRVTFSYGSLVVDTPQAWFLGCLILWVIFFPLYLTLTGRNPFTPDRR
jgi:hypothetical protein